MNNYAKQQKGAAIKDNKNNCLLFHPYFSYLLNINLDIKGIKRHNNKLFWLRMHAITYFSICIISWP